MTYQEIVDELKKLEDKHSDLIGLALNLKDEICGFIDRLFQLRHAVERAAYDEEQEHKQQEGA